MDTASMNAERGRGRAPHASAVRARTLVVPGVAILLMAGLDHWLFVVRGAGHAFWGRQHLEASSFAYAVLSAAIVAAAAPLVRLPTAVRERRALAALCVVAVAAALLLGAAVLQSFPNSGDEYAYWFQAFTYRAGRLWNAPPALGQAMASNYTWVTAGKWAGGYSPGWPAAMAVAAATGLPGWVANLVLLPPGGAMFFALVKRRAGVAAATPAAALFALSPFTLFNAGSYFPHILSATCVLLACWAADRLAASGRPAWGVLVGAAVGLLGLTRTVDAAILVLPLAAMLVRQPRFRTRWIWLIGAGGLPFLAGLLWYQWVLTGDPLEPTYYLGGRSVDHLYFDWPSVKIGAKLTARRLYELMLWTSAPALLLWLAALALKVARRRAEAFDALLPLIILVFLFYPLDGGNRYGPRYYFDFWASLPFTIATALPLMEERLRALATAVVVLAVACGGVAMVFLARDYHMLIAERRDLYLAGDRLGGGPAVVCIRSSSGLHLPLDPIDLPRNGIGPAGRIIYARCDDATLRRIRARLPTRRVWFYDRAADAVHGSFTPAR